MRELKVICKTYGVRYVGTKPQIINSLYDKFSALSECTNNIMFINIIATGLPTKKNRFCYNDPEEHNYYDNSRLTEILYIIFDTKLDRILKVVHTNLVLSNQSIVSKSSPNAKPLHSILDELSADLHSVDLIVANHLINNISILLSELHRSGLYGSLINTIVTKRKICMQDIISKHYQKRDKSLINVFNCIYPNPGPPLNKIVTIVKNDSLLVKVKLMIYCYFGLISIKRGMDVMLYDNDPVFISVDDAHSKECAHKKNFSGLIH